MRHPLGRPIQKRDQRKGELSKTPHCASGRIRAHSAWRATSAFHTGASPGGFARTSRFKTTVQIPEHGVALHITNMPAFTLGHKRAISCRKPTHVFWGWRRSRAALLPDPAPVATLCDQNGTSSLEEMKRATTFFTPAFSKATSNLSPSMPVIAPYPNFWWNTRSPSVKLEVAVRSIT